MGLRHCSAPALSLSLYYIFNRGKDFYSRVNPTSTESHGAPSGCKASRPQTTYAGFSTASCPSLAISPAIVVVHVRPQRALFPFPLALSFYRLHHAFPLTWNEQPTLKIELILHSIFLPFCHALMQFPNKRFFSLYDVIFCK